MSPSSCQAGEAREAFAERRKPDFTNLTSDLQVAVWKQSQSRPRASPVQAESQQ